MGIHLERALILYEQSRFDLAEQEVRKDLESEGDNATAHALLSLCLSERGEYREAMWAAQEAVSRDPELPFAHYALASVMQDRERLDEAYQSIQEAIRLDPKNTNFFAQLASIRCDQGKWQDALEATELGLRLDPGHVACINFRALALNKLGRASEARAAIETALARDPLNAVTHANQGWAVLQKGDPRAALEHFREALRLDAEFAMARHGIVECLKTRYLVYRLILRFMLWMAGLRRWAQWALIIGGAVSYLALLFLAARDRELVQYVWPFLGGYLTLGILTWIADPLFNLLLRLDPYGRLALTASQLATSNWVGLCLVAAALLGLLGLIPGWHKIWLLAGMCGVLVIPVTGIFDCPIGRPRRIMFLYTLGLCVLGLLGFGCFLLADETFRILGLILIGILIAGAFLSAILTLLVIRYYIDS
jgi:tetratricopeptide (TPR) repeat protein